MSSPSGDGRRATENPPHIRRVILASFIGTTIEWYDFFLYGTAAALVFNRLFFSNQDPLTGTLSAYGSFAIGFLARPLGGAIFGHFGDRIGRRAMLVWSLVIMGIATALIGLLHAHGYRGWLVVEAEQDPVVAPSYAYAKKGYDHLRELVRALQANERVPA